MTVERRKSIREERSTKENSEDYECDEYEEDSESEEEEEEEEEKEEEEQTDEITALIFVVMLIYSVTVVPLIFYYIPTGQKGVFFYYLTNKTTLDWNEFTPSIEDLSNIPLTSETRLTFIVHGFSESSHRPWIHRLAQATLSREDSHNIVMVVDYWDLHRAEYFWMRSNSHYVARIISGIIDNLVLHNNLQLSNTHLIGFSLGGQICGIVGANLKTGSVARITGLDPTFPYLDWKHDGESLDASDADLVVIIRTSVVSIYCNDADVDFYVNGGIVQPGCDLWWYPHFVQQACSHFRPVMMALEAEQRRGSEPFPSCFCQDYESYHNGSCTCDVINHFDLSTLSRTSSTFSEPY
ncbi:lipase member H-like [Palaemon carinicauda]|uniref:lipase member H-like n=1 Tax=Palaemon carinicauda TaxID=392227 RepID=UPI0035B58618